MIKGKVADHTVKGFDVSAYQPKTDFQKMKGQGYQFCFVKATEGVSYIDKTFKQFWIKAKDAGLVRGAYHFFHPKYDPIEQANSFCRIVGQLETNDLPLVMDWESTDGVIALQDRLNGWSFLNRVKTLTGKSPIIYGGPYFLEALNLSGEFASHPLWVAHYGVKAPLVPNPWTYFTFWQYSDDGVDYNIFNGSMEQLLKIAHG